MSEISNLVSLQTSWEYLKQTRLPVFIYGMGDGCLKLLREFDKYGIAAAGIFASDEFVRGHSFQGHLVHKLSDIESALGRRNFVIAMAFAAGYESLIKRIDEIDSQNDLLVPDTDVIGVGAFTRELFEQNLDKLERVYGLLADEKSKTVFRNVLSFKLTGRIKYLKNCETLPEEAYMSILRPIEREAYVDCGAFNGDTIRELLRFTDGRYDSIYALEPDSRSYRKLTEYLKGIGGESCTAINAAAWSEQTVLSFASGGGRQSQVSDSARKTKEVDAVSVDEVLDGKPATYIKYDVEGAEMQALKGSANTIAKFAPKLCVACYHRAVDMFELPLYIHRLQPDYKIYMRHYPYYPAWETNLFAVHE